MGREGGWAFHTDEGAAQFASSDGEAAALTIAQVLALATPYLGEPPYRSPESDARVSRLQQAQPSDRESEHRR